MKRFFFLIFILTNFNFIKADVTINSDSDAPVLTNFTVSPSYVDVTDGPVDITLSIDVEEASGQLTTTPAIIVSCNGNGGGPSANWSLVSGDVYDGTWNAIITIPETQGEDDFFLSSGNWEDKWGNRASLYPLNDCGSDNGGVTVVNDNAEDDAPVLTNFTVSPSYVDVTDGPVDVTLSIDVEEASGHLTITPAILVSCNGNGGGPSANWSLVSGDVYDGTWEATVTIPETQGDDDFHLSSGYWEDKWGNRTTLWLPDDCGSENGGVTVVNNHPPEINSSVFNIPENTTEIGYLDATDEDGESLEFFIRGTNLITIDRYSGMLEFKNPANFEKKNNHTFKVLVSDGTVIVKKNITVIVDNVNEAPELTKTRYEIYNGKENVQILEYIDPENDSVKFQLSGRDASHFTLGKNNGKLRLINSGGIQADKTFKIKVTISDGDLSELFNIKVIFYKNWILQLGNTINFPQNTVPYARSRFSFIENGELIYPILDTDNPSKPYRGSLKELSFDGLFWNEIRSTNGKQNNQKLGYNQFLLSGNKSRIFLASCGLNALENDRCVQHLPPQTGEGVADKDIYVEPFEYVSALDSWEPIGSVQGPFKSEYNSVIGGANIKGNIFSVQDFNIKGSKVCNFGSMNGLYQGNKIIKRLKKSNNGDWKQFGKQIKITNTFANGKHFLDKTGEKILVYSPTCQDERKEKYKLMMYEYLDSAWIKTDEITWSKDNGNMLYYIKVNEDFNKILLLQTTGKMIIYSYEDSSFSKLNQNFNQIYQSLQQGGFPTRKNKQSFDISDDFKTIVARSYDQESVRKVDIFRLKNKTWKRFLDPLYSPTNAEFWGDYLAVSKDGSQFAVEEIIIGGVDASGNPYNDFPIYVFELSDN